MKKYEEKWWYSIIENYCCVSVMTVQLTYYYSKYTEETSDDMCYSTAIQW
jgi:hypothetical protein